MHFGGAQTFQMSFSKLVEVEPMNCASEADFVLNIPSAVSFIKIEPWNNRFYHAINVL